ncbi:DinB family protein [Terriglobus albidus]|uniref:DinB family protein n=1 Tax=Terriglobus albidus TaxID=1592106 RepID=A0A5B9EFF6_9BACT|nr:DinB family protein [Terriglobus albidus]QEE29161.1 DinB family protein [Terriglobus albidus]
MVEPWLRGSRTEIEPIRRAVLHALDLAEEDLYRWSKDLSQDELHARPHHLPSVAFQLRHIARSLDRLLTYAEGGSLTEIQLILLRSEADPQGTPEEIFAELGGALATSRDRVLAMTSGFGELRYVGRHRLPVTLGGLLVHIADHTQRHVGQAITTAKVIIGLRQKD